MEKIVYSGPADSFAVVEKLLGSKFDVQTTEAIPDLLLPLFEQSVAFLDASMKVRIPAASINRANNLRVVVTATTGADHIDQEALAARGIPLLTLKGQTEILRDITAAAEHSWLLLMACARQVRGAIHHVENGMWHRIEFPGIMLKGKTLGIIGMGRNGSWMARYASAFCMRIQAYDPFVAGFPAGVQAVGLQDLLRSSDFVAIHVNLTPESKGMLNADKLQMLKPGCVMINTSRGELVDEEALVQGLREGRIAALGTDVLAGEPEILTSPLWQYAKDHPNVIITPHVGGFCPEAVNLVVEYSCHRILKHFGME